VATADTYSRFETAGGCSIISLLPELNDKQWANIEEVGTQLVERLNNTESPRLILDLTPLNYMGSAMVALIVRLYKAVNGRNGQMVVVNTHEQVFEVLKLAGLTKLWTIVESRDNAYSALGINIRKFSNEGAAPSEGTAIMVAGVIGTIGAVAGLLLDFTSSAMVGPKIAKLIEVGFAALGIVVGTMILAKQTGTRRNVGIVFLAVCVLVILGGIFARDFKGPATSDTQPKKAAIPLKTAPAIQVAASQSSHTTTKATAEETTNKPPLGSVPAAATSPPAGKTLGSSKNK
jgi:anti-anti-sigma factor